jgi:VIT1/CCC1 family predicted Fe2+/Mn2+ transporter
MINHTKKYLPELVYGGIDGSVTTFAIVAGVVGASLSSQIILVIGLASLVADGFSMGVSNYFSQKSENDLDTNNSKDSKNAKKTASATFISFIIVGAIPLIPYVIGAFIEISGSVLFTSSSLLTLVAFFFVGYVKGTFTNMSKITSGAEVLAVGAVAAFIAYFIGHVLSNIPA